jgi:hypothetical protein
MPASGASAYVAAGRFSGSPTSYRKFVSKRVAESV